MTCLAEGAGQVRAQGKWERWGRQRQELSQGAVLGCPGPPDWLRDEANGVWSFWGITYFGFSKVDLGSLDLPVH